MSSLTATAASRIQQQSSSIKSVAEFYRSIMKQQDGDAQSSVINNANMVVLNFSKAGKSVSFTIMKMGNKTNVSADGSALKVAAAKPAERAGRAFAKKPWRRIRLHTTGDGRRPLIAEESAACLFPSATPLAVGDK